MSGPTDSVRYREKNVFNTASSVFAVLMHSRARVARWSIAQTRRDCASSSLPRYRR